MDTSSDTGTKRHDARQIIEALPQRRHIAPENIERWLDAVQQTEPERIVWHARRLAGIGGSEIGDLLAAERGGFLWSTPREIVAAKLLMLAPDGGNGDTARGTHLEATAQADFRARYHAEPDTQVIETLKVSTPHPSAPWRVGNPDDLVLIEGKRYLVDYKVPKPDNLEETLRNGAPISYVAQLHHYRALLLERLGVEVDGLLLAPFSTNDWRSYAIKVPYIPALDADLMRIGEKYWKEHVLAGVLPEEEEKTPDAIIPAEDLPPEIREEMARAARLKALSDAAASAYDKAKKHLESWYRHNYGAPKTRVNYAGMRLSTRTANRLNKARAIELLQEAGEDLTTLEVQGHARYDDKLIKEALKRHGLEESVYTEEHKASLSLSSARKGAEAEFKQALSARAQELLIKAGLAPAPDPQSAMEQKAGNGDTVSAQQAAATNPKRRKQTPPAPEL